MRAEESFRYRFFMVKIVLKITRIAAEVSFHGYRKLELKYDIEDRVQKNKVAWGLIKDIKGFNIHVRKSSSLPIKKLCWLYCFPDIDPW
jgi:hypothetical protein